MLLKDPKDKSDLAFCRIWLLLDRWKKIQTKPINSDHFLYRLYGKPLDSIHDMPIWKQILNIPLPKDLTHTDNDLIARYFKFCSAKTLEDTILTEPFDIDNVVTTEEDIVSSNP